jgi:hypothetical protein
MSLPREVVRGRFLFLTRRCTQRLFLLRPDRLTNAAFLFCMMLAARVSGVQVILACAMSNHYHAIVYDRHGRYPEFIEHFHRSFARVMNERLERRENFWASGQASVVHLVDREALLEKLVYVATNPVSAHLVARVCDWPGVNTLAALLNGMKVEALRPTHYFRSAGKVAASLQFTPQLPQHAFIGDPASFLSELKARVTATEIGVAQALAAMGKRCLGATAVSHQPRTKKGKKPERKRRLKPTFATHDRRAWLDAVIRLREFRRAYAAARAKWRDGNRDVKFPAGTYWLRLHARVCVEDEGQGVAEEGQALHDLDAVPDETPRDWHPRP